MNACPPKTTPSFNFAPIQSVEQCWNNSQQLYDDIKEIVDAILAEEGTLPPPFVYPPPGVTDGTPGAPVNFLGEVRVNTVNSNLTNVPTSGATFGNIATAALPAGCWELSYVLQVFGGNVTQLTCGLDQNLGIPVADPPGNMNTWVIYTPGQFNPPADVPSATLYCPWTPFANSGGTLVSFRIGAWGIQAIPVTAPFTFTTYARRVR